MAASEGVDLEWNIVDLLSVGNKSNRKYSEKIIKQGKQCVDHIIKFAAGKKIIAYHSDTLNISAKPEPKTDIVLDIGGKKYYTSVKMAGPIQLASGQGSSTADLFAAVTDSLVDKTEEKVLASIIKELRSMPTRLLSQSNLPRIKEEGSEKVIKEFIKNGKIIQDKSYEYWLANNKPLLMNSIIDFIQKDDDFKSALIKEALTGKVSLSQYKGAAADSIVSPAGFYVINNQYVEKVKKNVKFDIRGKSRSGITGIAFRIETK